ncbi:hypothetical protein BH10ACT10_BH10ACT10_12050 [soil metagenome]
MSYLSRATRLVCTWGVGGVAVLTLSLPIPATADPGSDPGRGPAPGVDVGRARDEIPPLTMEQRQRLLNQIESPVRPTTRTVTVTVDDGALELLQVAIGALGGAALVAGGAAAVSTRRHRHALHTA